MGKLVVAFILLVAAPAQARPGFYIGLGIGPGFTDGSVITLDRQGVLASAGNQGLNLEATMPTAPTGLFRLGFNILGYAAIEAGATAQAVSLTTLEGRTWTAGWFAGARAYPMWHWQAQLPEVLQPLEPSIFLGLGQNWHVYSPTVQFQSGTTASSDEFGWSGGPGFRFGIGLEYFLVTFFKVGIDYNLLLQNYDTFLFNLQDGIDSPVNPTFNNAYHQLLLTLTFQFSPEQKQVRYDSPDSSAEESVDDGEPLLDTDDYEEDGIIDTDEPVQPATEDDDEVIDI